MKNLLVVFVKYPEPGSVKTRLAAGIGAHEAAAVYCRLVALTMEHIVPREPTAYDRIVYADPHCSLDYYRNWLPCMKQFALQQGDCLGGRMHAAFSESFAAGYSKVALIGSDCPDVSSLLIQDALNLLDDCDAVLGPAFDGGYYLIALKRDCEQLFKGIDWGTGRVMQQTIERLEGARLSRALLPVLRDVDRIEDLNFFRARGYDL